MEKLQDRFLHQQEKIIHLKIDSENLEKMKVLTLFTTSKNRFIKLMFQIFFNCLIKALNYIIINTFINFIY